MKKRLYLLDESNWHLSRLKEHFTVVCAFVLPVSRLLRFLSEVTTKLEHVIEIFIEIGGVSNVQVIFDIY